MTETADASAGKAVRPPPGEAGPGPEAARSDSVPAGGVTEAVGGLPHQGRSAQTFASRVTWVFVTRIIQLGLGLIVTFSLARFLGTEGRGVYSLLLLVPQTLFAIGQLGLPAAMSFFAARGRSLRALERISLVMTALVSAGLVAAMVVALPALESTALKSAPDDLLRISLVALPFQFALTFAGSILYARQRNRPYNVILVCQTAALLILVLGLVSIGGMGIRAALAAYLAALGGAAIAATYYVHRLVGENRSGEGPPVGTAEFVRYGLALYPQNVTGFFNYRADVFLLGWLLADARGPIGLYSLAVNLAEMIFYVPDSVSSILYPAVAGSERSDADKRTPIVCRLTVLLTLIAIAFVVPSAFIAVHILLPAFKDSLLPLVVIMPGILSLSVSKILASYISGLGRPLPVAFAATTALVVNLAVNLALIPRWGIVGAAAASLVSYTLHATILLTVSSRFARVPARDFIVPGWAEVERLRNLALAAFGTLRQRI